MVARELSNTPLMLCFQWCGFNHRIPLCCEARGGAGVAGLALAKGAVVRGITVGSKQQMEDATQSIATHNLSMVVAVSVVMRCLTH
ncbi:hypothetical protein N7530_012682 [Penicillium desertorum]|uniref:Alcohol dehydrogenase-like C-terminal domain-containing protein n=1 Tax=Penicillium desertorum TaxID=1303715 RepID=A0A9X0BFN2_9EURO|nr:hypothetical protein N7530_012682 [Penicillium desertorum]